MQSSKDAINLDGKTITPDNIKTTLKVLADNGIEPDECKTVLQAIVYTLLDVELDSMLG